MASSRPGDDDRGPEPGRWFRDARRRRLLALADVAAASAACVLVVAPERAIWLVALLPIWVLIAKLVGLYDHDHRALRHLTIDEVQEIVAWGGIGALIVALVATATPAGDLSLDELAGLAALAAGLDFAFRVGARAIWRATTPREAVLIVGNGPLATSMRRKLALFGDLHMATVEPNSATRVDRVVFARERLDAGEVAKLAVACHEHEAKFSLISPLRGQATPQDLSRLVELPVFEYWTTDVSRSTVLLKRGIDLLLGTVAAILVMPLIPVIALATLIDSGRPVFFTQTRAGEGGRPFRLFKFRTMQVGAPDALDQLVAIEKLDEPMFKLRHDPRVTGVGRILRRLSLDEIPQLWNLFRGDMGLVGPRPEQLELVDRYKPEHRFRLDVKPGLTGPMQVYGRGELTFSERLAVELDYVENLSVGRDLRILAMTPVTIIRGTGAF